MEAMTVRVQAITVGAETVTALVTATSRERYVGHPLARIEISLRLTVGQGESVRNVRERARDEVLRFLDVA